MLVTVRSQFAALLSLAGSAVSITSVTNVATGETITFSASDSQNSGLIRRQLDSEAFGRSAARIGAGAASASASVAAGAAAASASASVAAGAAAASAAVTAAAAAADDWAARRRLVQVNGAVIAVAVNLGASPSADDIAVKTRRLLNVAANPAQSAALFAPVAAQLSLASGFPARLFVATVSTESLVLKAPPAPPDTAPPPISSGGQAAIAIFFFIGWGLAYVFVWKPLRRGEVTPASLGLVGRAPDFVVQAADRALKAFPKLRAAGSAGSKVAPHGERPSSAEDPTGAHPSAAAAEEEAGEHSNAQLEHHWSKTLAAASHEDAAFAKLPPLRLADEAAAGSAAAQGELGERYLRGVRGVPKDLALAALWLQRAADAGLPRGEALLGALFLRGEAVFVSAEADYDLGIDLVHRAAEHGVVAAQHLIDRLHRDADEPQAGPGGGRMKAARQRARELVAPPPLPPPPPPPPPPLPQQVEQKAPPLPAERAAAAAAAAAAMPLPASARHRPGSTVSVEEETLAVAERVAWGANEEEEYVPARRNGSLPLSPRRTAWVEPEQPSFGVPTRHDVLIGQRRAGSSGAGAAPARY